MTRIPESILAQAMSYPQYRQLADDLHAAGKTTGHQQSPALLEYTRMNLVRMARLDKTTRLQADTMAALAALPQPQTWLVITESWCGDAAQVLPVLAKMAEAQPAISLRLVLRDDNPALMDAFLTNGSRSIPKLIVLDSRTHEVLGTWGPRPQPVQRMVMDSLSVLAAISDPAARAAKSDEVKTDVQRWYAQDKTVGIQAEVVAAAMQGIAAAIHHTATP